MENPTTSPTDESPFDLHAFVLKHLASDNHRYTTGRHRLVDALAGSHQPLTLPDIVAIAPDLAASSVYRNLEVLEQCGIVKRIANGRDHAHFELAEPLLSHHHHLVCIECGGIEDVRLDDEIEELLDQHLDLVASRASFKPVRHSLDLEGQCERCQGQP